MTRDVHRSATDSCDDRRYREDYGRNPQYSSDFDKGNQARANKYVGPGRRVEDLWLFSHFFPGKYLMKLAGRTDLEDALKGLDKLTQEEARIAAAQLLKIAHNIESKLIQVIEGKHHALSWLQYYPESLCDLTARRQK